MCQYYMKQKAVEMAKYAKVRIIDHGESRNFIFVVTPNEDIALEKRN